MPLPRSGWSWRRHPQCRGCSPAPAGGGRSSRSTPAVMLVYLWHMVPVVIVEVAFYPTGVMPQPTIGSAQWWELRPAWIALLAAVLIPLIAGLLWVHRPLLRVLPPGSGPASPLVPGRLGGRPGRRRVRPHQARDRRLCSRRLAATHHTPRLRLQPAADAALRSPAAGHGPVVARAQDRAPAGGPGGTPGPDPATPAAKAKSAIGAKWPGPAPSRCSLYVTAESSVDGCHIEPIRTGAILPMLSTRRRRLRSRPCSKRVRSE